MVDKKSCYDCKGFYRCFGEGFYGGYTDKYAEICKNYRSDK